MATFGRFFASAGSLTFTGDSLGNSITISRDAAGRILGNGGAIPILGGIPTVANTSLIQVFGLSGDDIIALSEANGALPSAKLFGGTGNDTLTGGSGADQIFGQSDHDTLLGRGGADLMFGGDGDDTLTGGDADDQMFGEDGDDRMIWNPGDDTDLHEGGAGIDTTEVNGGGGAELFTITANGTRVRFDRIDPAPFALDIGTTEKIIVNMNGGDDSFSATGNLAALIGITVDGGAGDDTILGSNGADLLLGGADDDFIDGQQGGDTAFLGAGDDVFQWDPGDGSDVVEGQEGSDEMAFNGSAGNEIFAASANGGRVLFTRNLGNNVMDLDDVETITLKALGGTDTVTINDLSGTDVTEVDVNLAGTLGGSTGDAAVDTVIANATNGGNAIEIVGSGTNLSVIGLPALINISNSEGANDSLVINALDGDDQITATTLPAGVVKLTLDGGAGDDNIFGSQGADVFLGGSGDDFVFGDNGNDVALLGANDDVFQWDPGDGNDTVEGQDGVDALRFNGSGASENVSILANGGRVLLFRDVANVTMDLNDVETIDFRAFGGADNIVVGDISGTDLTRVDIDLAGPVGGGDGAGDTVTVNATNGADTFGAFSSADGSVTVFGLQSQVVIHNPEGTNDRLTLNGLGEDDVIDATSLEAGHVMLTMNGGLGDDVFLGSEGDDLVNGGDGDDIALMGDGDDVFVWNPGDDNDTIEGQAGIDTMLFNGSNAGEAIDISANGGRAVFFRNVANVLMDLDDTEVIDYNALGGADTIVVNDLTGTDVTAINIDLGAVGGGDDAQPDTIVVNATNGDDVIQVINDGGVVRVIGLAAEIEIANFGVGDSLVINALGGDDVIEASALLAGIQLVGNGGFGNDILIGGEGGDVLTGGEGDDVLLGGPGIDVLDGGPDDDIEIQFAAQTVEPMMMTPEAVFAL